MLITRLVNLGLKRPRQVFAVIGAISVICALQFFRVKIDTDPENMLPADEFVRVFDREVKKEFALYDYIVVGVVNEVDSRGVFNPATLATIRQITLEAARIDGVIGYEMMSLSNKDDIEQAGPGEINFRWLMGEPPYSDAEAARIRERALANPLFYNTLISEDSKALVIYVPIQEKKLSYRVAREIRKIISRYPGQEKYYLTGLPLAQDAFGHEMFVQMGVSAPLAVLVIFLFMLYFFKNLQLVVMPLVMAIAVVIMTMGFLVGFGFPIHIMSSMIPIFLLPIAVLDSIHILNEFFEQYRKHGDKNKTISHVLHELYRPNLFTSLTTIAGFISLAFARIPPVQVFGLFVALGVAIAWVLTVIMVPAYVALIDEKRLKNFGVHAEDLERGLFNTSLHAFGRFTAKRWKAIIVATLLVIGLSIWGISRIEINDNPTKWFSPRHPIRVADIVLNSHFGGTYSAYLVLDAKDKEAQVFQDPQALRYIENLQSYLQAQGQVGKSTTLADITKKVYYELLGAEPSKYRIPDTREAVAQCLLMFENSHKPDDLWHFVTPDYSRLNVWLQLRSGDNRDMTAVVKQVDAYFKAHPFPVEIERNWAGMPYINMVWQSRMVGGMLENFLGSFVIVLIMMIILFRSFTTGLISMIPLSVTILFIYGSLGFTGKDYDMPVAVLSALTLGLAVDFAIHFLERSRELNRQGKKWPEISALMFKAPGRALMKNALVISVGFLPLFASPLVPYNTVGLFMFLIMLTASIGTMLILPALISGWPRLAFGKEK